MNPFVLKLAPTAAGNGYYLEKIHIFGSYCQDRAFDVAVDKNGNVYVAGETYAGGDPDYVNFDLYGISNVAPARRISHPSTSGLDVFVARLDNNLIGKSIHIIGSNGNDDVFGGIDTDNNGNIYLVGNTGDRDMLTYQNKFSALVSGSCYVVKFNPSSTNIVFLTYIDPQVGVENQTGGKCNDMLVSPDGKIYIVGVNDGAYIDSKAFLYIMDGSNQNTVHIERISGSDTDEAISVYIDDIGNPIFAGKTYSQDLLEINPIQNFNTVDHQNGNTFIAKLSFKEKLEVSIGKQYNGQGTVKSNPIGIDCPNNSCSYVYDIGAKITLTADASQGSVFVGWEGDCLSCKDNLSCSITLKNYTNCIAHFDTSGGNGGGSEKKSQSSNPDIKITTTNKLKYQFKTDGLYEVRCSATDSKGNKSIESDSVTVDVFTNGGGSNTPPSISTFRPDIYSGYAPLKVIFNWNVSDKDNDSVSCTLDTDNDGIVDYAINDCISTKSQFHTYQSNGKYTAKLIAIDTKNNKTEKTVNIEVYYKTTTKDGKEVKVLAENATINKANIIDTANIPSLPSNVKALYAISFKSTLKQGEDTVTVKFKLPSNIPSNVKIYKLVNNQYIDITDKVYKNGNTIEL